MKQHLILPTATMAAISLAAALVAPATASASGAGATVTAFSATSTETFEGSLPECFTADLAGTNVLTDTATGQIVKTSSGIFTVHGTDVTHSQADERASLRLHHDQGAIKDHVEPPGSEARQSPAPRCQ